MTIRIPCDVEGHEDDWIEFDTSAWGLVEFDLLMGQYPLKSGLVYVKTDSVDWHVTGSNGPVKHPGRGAGAAAWRSTWRQIGPEGLRLSRWLGQAPGLALVEAVQLSRKSVAGNDGRGPRPVEEPAG